MVRMAHGLSEAASMKLPRQDLRQPLTSDFDLYSGPLPLGTGLLGTAFVLL